MEWPSQRKEHGQEHGQKHYDWEGAKVLQKGFSTNVYLITWRLGGLVGGCQGPAQGLWQPGFHPAAAWKKSKHMSRNMSRNISIHIGNVPRPCRRALAARLPHSTAWLGLPGLLFVCLCFTFHVYVGYVLFLLLVCWWYVL